MQPVKNKTLYTLSEACELLSVSTATGRNWVKSGRLIAVAGASSKKPLFEEHTVLELKEALANGKVSGLKSRRNKTCLSDTLPAPEEFFLRSQLRRYAEQLILAAGYHDTSLYQPFLDALSLNGGSSDCLTPQAIASPEEDPLGQFYLSLQSLGDRKSSGSYYTSAKLAKHLIEQHLPSLCATQTIFDPSCGTGIFLLQLPKEVPLTHIYGNDINPVSVAITKINLALKYHITTKEETELLQSNITVADFLTASKEPAYDIILGNPPWGARLSDSEKKYYREHFSCASGSSVEIFDLFVEQSLKQLKPNGTLAFILPEAILNVKTHTPIRELLLQHTNVRSVEYLGEAFAGVNCPSIIFSLEKDTSRPFYKGRRISADCFSFSLTEEEYHLTEKIQNHPNHTTLTGQADFALGIVTGNNTAFLHKTPAPGLEPVLKGNNIRKYHIDAPSGYLSFQPKHFQQVAPEALYRAPEKLFYRFINKRLIFAYDNAGLLSLNSCNILIPRISGLSVKYVLAVLNSSVAQFFFEKKFHSVKVLRSHLEQIPIPLAEADTQREIAALVDKLMELEESTQEFKKTYFCLDRKVAELFLLTQKEYKMICN